ncbi:MAG: hypothetical protein R2762_23935 [Bryobacteraceae bacterium]
MRGRPPIPIAQKRAQGDTRQRGAKKHEAALAEAFEARRGRPPMPDSLKFGASCKSQHPDAKIRKIQDAATRARLKMARDHWEYLADELAKNGMLASLDEGMLTGQALNYALGVEAAREGRETAFSRIWQRYMQIADRMGLSESARARLPSVV